MHGWTGKILTVDLANAGTVVIATEPYARQYVGGRGVASRLYWETVKPETGAFDPGNRLIFMTGPLVATGAPGASRMAVTGKSPMTFPEGYCYGNIGGFFGDELKKAGFDGIVIEGRAPRPVYLWINDGDVEFCDASSLWGKGAIRAGEMLEEAHGKKARFLTTGVAGENLVRSAVIFGSHRATSAGGYGAVMGSKNLKAIVVLGTGRPSVADPARLKELSRYIAKIDVWQTLTAPPNVMMTGHSDLVEVVGKDPCARCGLKCNRQIYRVAGRLVGPRRCQSMEYYLPWRFGREDEPVETFFDAPDLANDYSIDTFELQAIIEWLDDCYRSGSISEEETGLPLSRIGTREFLEKLLHAICYREGFGSLLAEGLVRAAARAPEKARLRLSHTVAPVGKMDGIPARATVVNALLYPMEPRIHQPLTHEVTFVQAAWAVNQMRPDLSPIDTKKFHDIARAFWGSDAAADLSSYEGKALAAVKTQDRTYLKDSLGLCDYAWPITYSFTTPDYLGDPELEAEVFTAATGVAGEELDRCAARICNLQRAILVREGRRLPGDDFPPEFNFTEPLPPGPGGQPVLVPGPGETTVDAVGRTLDKEKFIAMLKEYYRLRGWDVETGRPLPETLAALGLADLAGVFWNI
jgi:aldehyde:ferredoxin oxidoreductase